MGRSSSSSRSSAVRRRVKSSEDEISHVQHVRVVSTDNDGIQDVYTAPVIDPKLLDQELSEISNYTCMTENWLFRLTGSHALIGIIKDIQNKRKWFNLNFVILLGCFAHMIYCWQKVLYFLKWYYPDRNNDLIGKVEKETGQVITQTALWFIAGSYFVIDFIYPVAFFLLVDLFARDVLRSVTATMVKECGVDQYEDSFKKKIARNYSMHISYCGFHVALLLIWLGYLRNYPVSDVGFWCIIFGIPHALNPILLTVVITRIFEASLYRVKHFREKFTSGEYKKDANAMWDAFVHIRNDVEKLSGDMQNTIGVFIFALGLAISGQAFAVFLFRGDQFSMIYLLLNVWCLFWVVYGAQEVMEEFNATTDDVIHSDTKSTLGAVDSKPRTSLNNVMIHATFAPSFRAFSMISLSKEALWNTTISSFLAIIGVIWETFELKKNFFPEGTAMTPAVVPAMQ